MGNYNQWSVTTRGADGRLYSVSPGSCVLSELGETEIVEERDCRSAAGASTPHWPGDHVTTPSAGSGDYAAARPVIDPGDYAAARPVIDPGDYAAARPVIDPGDYAAARPVIDPGDHALGSSTVNRHGC